MSLSWNVENIRNYEEVCWIGEKGADDRHINPVTETLIFGTIMVGMGSITIANVGEFAARFRIMEKTHGPFLRRGGGEEWYVSDEEFTAHIGLVTNVTNETRAKWASRIFVKPMTSVTEEIASLFRRNMARTGVKETA